MPNDYTQPATPTDASAPLGAAGFASSSPAGAINDSASPVAPADAAAEVARKIGEAHNVLIALSGDPSVDELSAAIGLSIFLDKNDKRATAIYSGATPNAIEFLNPEQTFEPTVDSLQDFVIALNKEKADHLRYKVDGDYVKIFVTPYSSKISENDLEFSYGDYNVDLVIALDVVNGIDLDSALREHGRIMHDATIINITTGNPGKFGEIEWSDKHSSSVSEMVSKLLYGMNFKEKIGKEEATAFLTGIVAATERFSNAATTPDTMRISSRLMESGANQQLIAKNITSDIDNELYAINTNSEKDNSDQTNLEVSHNQEEGEGSESSAPSRQTDEVGGTITQKESTLLDDLKAAEASLAMAGAEVTQDNSNQPIRLDSSTPDASATPEAPTTPEAPVIPEVSTPEAPAAPEVPIPEASTTPEVTSTPSEPTPTAPGYPVQTEKVIAPPTDSEFSALSGGDEDYGKMLEEALTANPEANPAAISAPQVSATPEINGVPEINYMPMPGEETLPPPMAPPIDMSATIVADQNASLPSMPSSTASAVSEPAPAVSEPAPAVEPVMPPVAPVSAPTSAPASVSTVEPASVSTVAPAPTQPSAPSPVDPSAFKIPGM